MIKLITVKRAEKRIPSIGNLRTVDIFANRYFSFLDVITLFDHFALPPPMLSNYFENMFK